MDRSPTLNGVEWVVVKGGLAAAVNSTGAELPWWWICYRSSPGPCGQQI